MRVSGATKSMKISPFPMRIFSGMEVAFVARVGIGGDARLYVGLHFQSFVQNQAPPGWISVV